MRTYRAIPIVVFCVMILFPLAATAQVARTGVIAGAVTELGKSYSCPTSNIADLVAGTGTGGAVALAIGHDKGRLDFTLYTPTEHKCSPGA